jgi:hypothetical protein
MKKYIYKMKGFNEIYENTEKEKIRKFLSEKEKKIENIFLNKNLKLSLIGMTVHKIVYIIEKENISLIELEQIIYSSAYFFLKEYIDIKKLIILSKMNELELKKNGEKSIELIKKDYKIIEKKELNIEEIFFNIKKFVEWEKNNE